MTRFVICAASIAIGLFFEIYIIEWLIKLLVCRFNFSKAYKSISFEQEAYYNQGKIEYPDSREYFKWIEYIFSLYKKK